MRFRDQVRPSRAQMILGVSSALCYALGYPIALIGGSPIGWVLVTLGGVVLAALFVVTVRRIDRAATVGSTAPRREDEPPQPQSSST